MDRPEYVLYSDCSIEKRRRYYKRRGDGSSYDVSEAGAYPLHRAVEICGTDGVCMMPRDLALSLDAAPDHRWDATEVHKPIMCRCALTPLDPTPGKHPAAAEVLRYADNIARSVGGSL